MTSLNSYYQLIYPSDREENIEGQQLCDYSNDHYFESEMIFYDGLGVWIAKRFLEKWLEFTKEFMFKEDYEALEIKLKNQL